MTQDRRMLCRYVVRMRVGVGVCKKYIHCKKYIERRREERSGEKNRPLFDLFRELCCEGKGKEMDYRWCVVNLHVFQISHAERKVIMMRR